MKRLQRNVRRTGQQISSVGKGMTLGLTLPILAFGKVAYDEFTDAQKANAQTAAVLKSTGAVAGVTAGHVQKLSTAILNMSGIDDQAAQSAQNLLLTFTGIRNEAGRGNKIFDKTTMAIMDMATAMNHGAVPSSEQLKTTTIQVGKAINDPIKGITALRKVGVSFTEQQKQQIKKLVHTGKAMQAQKLILHELNREFGGSAAAAGKTLPAQLAKLRESFAGVGASLLSTLMPNIQGLLRNVQSLINWFGKLSPSTRKWTARLLVLGAVMGPVLIAVGSMVTVGAALIPIIAGIELETVGVVIAIAALVIGFVVLYRKSETVRAAVNALWAILKASPLGQLIRWVNNVAQSMGGWRAVFLKAKLDYLLMLQSMLRGFVTLAQAGSHIPGEVGRQFSKMATGAKRDINALDGAIVDTMTDLQQLGPSAAKNDKQFKRVFDANVARARSFGDYIRIAKQTYENWKPSVKTPTVQLRFMATKGNLGGNPLLNTNGTPNRDGNPLTPFARGGIVTRPTAALIGEAGPEAVIPLNRARGIGNTYNIMVNAQGQRVDSLVFMRNLKTAARMGMV